MFPYLITKEEVMKRTCLAAAVFTLAFAVPVSAADSGQPQTGQALTFEQRQAEILKIIDARAAGIQTERSCVQAARNFDDLKACRDKAMADMKGHGPGGGQMPPRGQ